MQRQRRDMMRTMAAAGLCAAGWPALAGRGQEPFFAAHDLPIGLQLYTVGPDMEADFAGTLQRVADIGYRNVETSLGTRSPAEWAAALRKAGLCCPSIHMQVVGLPGERGLTSAGPILHELKAMGVTDIVVPIFLPPQGQSVATLESLLAAAEGMTADDWGRNAAMLNEHGALLARHGLRLSYHNHNPEFRTLPGGKTGFGILLEQTNPKLVSFEMDAGWIAAAGQDPVAILRAYPGRFTQMHVKDIKAGTAANHELKMDPAEVGSGSIDFTRVIPAAYAAGVRRFFVEQEAPFALPRIAAVAKSYRYLRLLMGA